MRTEETINIVIKGGIAFSGCLFINCVLPASECGLLVLDNNSLLRASSAFWVPSWVLSAWTPGDLMSGQLGQAVGDSHRQAHDSFTQNWSDEIKITRIAQGRSVIFTVRLFLTFLV